MRVHIRNYCCWINVHVVEFFCVSLILTYFWGILSLFDSSSREEDMGEKRGYDMQQRSPVELKPCMLRLFSMRCNYCAYWGAPSAWVLTGSEQNSQLCWHRGPMCYGLLCCILYILCWDWMQIVFSRLMQYGCHSYIRNILQFKPLASLKQNTN